MGQPIGVLPDPLDQPQNIRERLPKAITMVSNGGQANELGLLGTLSHKGRQAVAVTWLFHLIGDMHQPLHVVAMVEDSRWPAADHGDQGGNLIAIVVNAKTNETALLLGWRARVRMNHDNLNGVIQSFASDPPYSATDLTSLSGQMDFDDWVEDGYKLAVEFCYLNGTLHLSPWRDSYDNGALADSDVPVLPQSTKDNAKRIYRQRLQLAGERLANQIKSLFP